MLLRRHRFIPLRCLFVKFRALSTGNIITGTDSVIAGINSTGVGGGSGFEQLGTSTFVVKTGDSDDLNTKRDSLQFITGGAFGHLARGSVLCRYGNYIRFSIVITGATPWLYTCIEYNI